MEVPGLGVESEQQLLAYATATAIPDPSCVFNLHHSSRQPNPLSKAKDQICIFMDTSRVLNPLSHNRNSTTSLQFTNYFLLDQRWHYFIHFFFFFGSLIGEKYFLTLLGVYLIHSNAEVEHLFPSLLLYASMCVCDSHSYILCS